MSRLAMTLQPAAEGDSIVLTWGDAPAERRALIDLGRTRTYKILKDRLVAASPFDLFVVTHVDADHIEGVMPFVRPEQPAFEVGEIWFNGHKHLAKAKARWLQEVEVFSVGQGEKLSAGIAKFGWSARWNAAFTNGPVSVGGPQAAVPIVFGGDLSVRLLAPADADLAALEPEWRCEIERMGLTLGTPDLEEPDGEQREHFGQPDVEKLAAEPFVEDTAIPNGTSIAFLAEHTGRRLLLTGDAHPRRIEEALRRQGWSEGNRLGVDCWKMSHHGSKANTSPSLIGVIDCTRFAFSTDGTRHDHPHPQTIARLLVADPVRAKELIFNVRQPNTTAWDVEVLKARWNYRCIFPEKGQDSVTIEI